MNKINFKGSVMLNPTPVVLVTSKNKEGTVNAFTVGWISTVCTKEPIIAMGVRPERLSYEYIKESEECVINLTTKEMVKMTDYCGVVSGRKQDKIKHLGIKLNDGVSIGTPSIEVSPVALECKLKSITPLGTHDLFLLEVVNVKVNENLIDEKGKIHFENANLISYCHGEYFALNPNVLGKFGYSVSKNNVIDTKSETASTTKSNKTKKKISMVSSNKTSKNKNNISTPKSKIKNKPSNKPNKYK